MKTHQILNNRGGVHLNEQTQVISTDEVKEEIKRQECRIVMRDVYNALCEKGYNPLAQIVGYLLSEDPTYITSYNGARTKIVKIDRYELLENIVKDYIETQKF